MNYDECKQPRECKNFDTYTCLFCMGFTESTENHFESIEKWNENVETCSDCGIEWKKIGKSCPVCYAPPENHTASE